MKENKKIQDEKYHEMEYMFWTTLSVKEINSALKDAFNASTKISESYFYGDHIEAELKDGTKISVIDWPHSEYVNAANNVSSSDVGYELRVESQNKSRVEIKKIVEQFLKIIKAYKFERI